MEEEEEWRIRRGVRTDERRRKWRKFGRQKRKNSMNKSRNIKKRREKEGVEEKGGGLSKGRDGVK